MDSKTIDRAAATRSANEFGEGKVAKAIENQTARIPSDVYLWASVGSIVGSLALKFMGQDRNALFVGQWAPTFLILGLYNKIVKVEGNEGEK